jgi:GT2 family glycosyltransferase
MTSIIIPTYQHLRDCLRPCCDSIISNTDPLGLEVIVVANGCGNDGTRAYIESLGSPFKLIWVEEALGYTKATNIGIQESRGQTVILLNNDCVLLPQARNTWLEMLCEPLQKTVAITGPLQKLDPVTGQHFMIFFCVAIQRHVLNQCGLLDESFSPGGGEDIDFCIRATASGYTMMQVPTPDLKRDGTIMVGGFPIYHKGEATFGKLERWQEIFDRNMNYLRAKHQ